MMSAVVDTLRPASQRIDELVPSRYALRVGEIDVLVVSDGVLPLPSSLLATNATTADLTAWLDDRGLPPDMFSWPLNAVLVRSGRQTVLIDTGVGDAFPDFRAGLLPKRLEAAGIDLATVTDVVITHAHMDHVGGLLADGFRSRLRSDVPIHLAAAEAEFWASPDFSHGGFPERFPEALESAGSRFLAQYRGQLRLFNDEHEVAPGVVVRRNGGHTPGHSVVRVSSGGQALTFLGDSVFPDHFDHPDWYNAFDHEPEEAVRVRARLLRELAATRELLVAAHLPFPSVGRVAVDGDSFRWIPGTWDY